LSKGLIDKGDALMTIIWMV